MRCVYDNPNTMARELWDSGLLISSVSAMSMMINENKSKDGEFFESEMGLWKTGQWVGDIRAIIGQNND